MKTYSLLETQDNQPHLPSSALNPEAPIFIPSPEPLGVHPTEVVPGEGLEGRRHNKDLTMESAPGGKDVQEFKFRRLCNLKLIPSGSKLDRSYPLSVLSTSNKFGVIFAGTPTGVQCIPLSDVVELQETRSNNRGEIENYKRRELNLGCHPSHVAVNCVGDLLAVVVSHQQIPVLQIYSVQSFGSQVVTKVAEVRMSSTPNTRALDLQWNPAIPNMIGCVLSDGSAMVCEFNPNGGPNISSAPPSAQATCLCWSPKGKQVVLGAKNGTLTQYKPDLKAVKSYPPPHFGTGQLEIVSIHWLSTVQFIVVYKDRIDPQARSTVVVVNVPKTGQSFVNYDDICFSTDVSRHEHYFVHIAAWNVLIISNGNALEVSVLHQENDSWVQWRQDEGSRAELPLTESKDDVFTVGMALSTNATKPIPIGDTGTIPPAPFLLYMSEQGVLSIFHTMNLFPGVAELCSPPQELPRQFFSVPEAVGEPKSQPAVTQDKPGAALPSGIGGGDGSVAQAVKSGFPVSPFQLGSQPATPSVAPFQLSGGASTLPSFGSLTAQLGSQAPSPFAQSSPQVTPTSASSVKPLILNVPKAQPTFGLGTTLTPQTSGSGLFGGSSAAKPDSSQSVGFTTAGSLGAQFSLSTSTPSMASQLMPKPQAAVPATAAPGVTSASSVISFQPAAPSPTPPPPKESPSPAGPPPVDDSMIMSEIIKEVASVKSLLANVKLDSAAVRKLEKDELTLPEIRVKLHDLEVFEEELRETTASEQAEVNALKISVVEMFSCLENIKAKQRQSTSQRYLEVLESRELDPVLKKMLKNIEQTTLYVETKLKEATHHLNVTWEKQKESGSLKNFDIPNMEAIYQIIAMNMKILAVQQARVAELESRLASALILRKKTVPRVLTESNPQWKPNKWSSLDRSKQNTQLEKLADKLLQTRIDSDVETSHSVKETSDRYFALANFRKELPKEKEAMLWKWLKSHNVVRTKVARPAMPDNDVLNRSFAKSTPTKSPISIAETPLINPAKAVSRNLFSTQPAPASSVGPALVTSTPLVSKTSDGKFKEKTSFSIPSFESPPISISPVEPKLPAQTAVKSVFGSPFGGTLTAAKETVSSAKNSATSAFNVSPFQAETPKVDSLFSSPQTPRKPKDYPKNVGVESAMTQQVGTTVSETKSSPVSTAKSATSTNVISLLSSGSTVTISEKDKAPGTTTTAGSIFGSSAFGQSGGFTGFGSSIGSGTTQSTSVSATITGATSSAKPSLFGPTSISFSAGMATSAPTTTAAPTATSSFSFGNLPTSSQNLFSGSGFPFSQAAKPASTASSTTPIPSVSIFSLPSSTAASTTTGSSILSGSLSSTTSSSVFPGFGVALSSSATPTVTVTSLSKTASQPTPATEVSSSVAQAAPPTQTTGVSTAASTTGPVPGIAAAATTSAPSVTASAQATVPEKPATTSEFSFGSLSLTPVTSNQSLGVQAFQTTSPTTTATTSTTLSFGGTVISQPSGFTSTTSQSFTSATLGSATTTASIFGGAAAATTTASSTLFQTPPKSGAAFSGGSLFGTPTTSVQSFGTPTTSAPAFGTPTTSAPPAFGSPTTSTLSFGTPTTSAPPAFGTPTSPTQPSFGTATSAAPSVFGTPTTSAQPAFGSPASTAQSPFGSQAAAPAFNAATGSPSVFGTPTTTSSTNIFGAVNALSNTSFFGTPTTTSSGFGAQAGSIFGGASSFSTPSASSSSIFGAKICSPDAAQTPANTSNPFGSPFGQKTPTAGAAFGGTPSFGSYRPSTPGAFGSSGGSIFGGGAGGSTFGQPTQQGGIFQSAGSSPGVFGSPAQSPGAFSTGGQSVQQTGFGSFGSPQQQQPRPFGASGGSVFGGQAAFGSAPTFGGTATFGGSPTNKVFGAATPAPAFGAPTQQSSTFENLAAQNTVSFGNLAQTSPPFGGGSTFGQPQPQPQQQQQQQQQQTPAFSNTPAFGGSSFSSWR